ncbi:TcdA/TcdB pore-forming domain-containing protein [Microseira wollei]|uniref:Toxin B n=1 Tax=Microseira wollei NIES-4236 TaxID=2530354 RepID=A0AAV3XIL5_9CYAN|nr:TcdA/TcdB pore-forming domain-containing protein [Microseira wollei]GET41436.1 toxin B [Microseira wollei NIES-4236]
MVQNIAISGFGRSFLVQKILDAYLAVEQTERWTQAVKTLNQQAQLGSNWVPIIQNVEATAGQDRVQFINKNNLNETRWIQTNDPTFRNFRTFFNEQAQNLGEMFQVDSVTGQVTSKTSSSSVSAGVGVGANKADLVKTVINWVAEGKLYEKSGNPDLDLAVGVQSYLNLTQYGHGVVTEVAQVITEILPALRNGGAVAKEVSESLVTTVVKTSLTEGLGVILSIGNVILDGIVLSKTSSTPERASITTTLVFDVTATATSLLSLGLGLVGASTAASILGVIAVPIAGLAAGIPTLVALYAQRTENAQKVAEPFGTIAQGYAANSDGSRGMTYQAADQYKGIQSALKPKGGAVIAEIDLIGRRLTFGSQYLYQVNPDHPGAAHTKVNNRDSFSAGPDVGWVGNSRAKTLPLLSVREGLGCPQTVQLQNTNVDVIVLPRDIEMVFDYKHGIVAPLWQENYSSPGINALRTIESHFYERFYYDYWATSDFAIDQFKCQYRPTTVTLKLDKARRTVLIPQQLADIEKSNLTYRLEGNGGNYAVVLSEQDINIKIKASNDPDERWIFNIDRIGFGARSTQLRPSGCWKIVFNDDGFTIGQTRAVSAYFPAAEPQRVRFEGAMPKNIVLCDNIGHIFMVNLQEKNMSLLLDITRKELGSLEEEQTVRNLGDIPMDMRSQSLLYRAYVSYQYLKNSTDGGGKGIGILESVPLTNGDNIGILYKESNYQYTGTWDPSNFALVAYHSDSRGTDLQVDRSDNYDNIREGHLPQKLGFSGQFEKVWTENNQIFFTEKMPQQGSEKPSVLQYCMYSGSGFYYIDAIDASRTLMDKILGLNLSELKMPKIDELLRQTGWTPYFQAGDPNRSYAYGKDTYTIVGQNSQGVGYQIKVYQSQEASLSWKLAGIQYQILPGSILQLTGTQDNNTISLPNSMSWPTNYPNLAKNIKKAILFGKEGTDTYTVNMAILDYEAIFILNYAKDTSQDTLKLLGMRKGDFSYFQQGKDLVLIHKQSHHWINIVGVFEIQQANSYQHLQLSFSDGSFAVSEVGNNLSVGSPDEIYMYMNLEALGFQRQGDDLVVLRQDQTDGIAYSNFYKTYTSLNALRVNFPSTTGTTFNLNAQELAALGLSKVTGQALVNAGSAQQFVNTMQASPENRAIYEVPAGSTVRRNNLDLVIGSQVYQKFFERPAQDQQIKIPLILEDAVIIQNNSSLMFRHITYGDIYTTSWGDKQASYCPTNEHFCEFSGYYNSNNYFGDLISVQMPLRDGRAVILSNAALTLFGWKTLRYLEQFNYNSYNDIGPAQTFTLRFDTQNKQVVAYQFWDQEIARHSVNVI